MTEKIRSKETQYYNMGALSIVQPRELSRSPDVQFIFSLMLSIGDETSSWAFLLAFAIAGSFALLFAVCWLGWRLTARSHSISPYTGIPLRRATDIPYYSVEKIMRYLQDVHQYDNRIFKLNRAAFCRETGRVFQDCITWYDVIDVDWNFLHKRYSGHYVSWGSLSRELQDAVRSAHLSLEGFQTLESSPSPSPRAVEPAYAYTKPGPLYVDPETKILLGWKIVPGTEFELLMVQKPIQRVF